MERREASLTTTTSKPHREDRRRLLSQAPLASAALLGLGSMAAHARTVTGPAMQDSPLLTTPRNAVVATRAGRVRGFKRGEVYTFKGIPYGADTSGANRFQPPRPPVAWSHERPSLAYGPVCPQPPENYGFETLAFLLDWNHGYQGEDCLRVNVWSPTLDRAARLPVMVWLHGGGFWIGSGHQLPAYDGENLARQNAVVVSLNHRLGPLGFLDLSASGGDASSGNVGMLDIVQALQWVHENIAGFGGDPGHVTVFGQSGGGAKVSTLMGMPAAKGLFHRAIVMSGSFPPASPAEQTRSLAAATLAALNLEAGSINRLQALEPARIIEAGAAARAKLGEQARQQGRSPGGLLGLGPQFGPSFDARVLVGDWVREAPALSSGVSLIVGNTRDEFRPPTIDAPNDAALGRYLPPHKQGQKDQIVAALRQALPNAPSRDLALILGGMFMRQAALEQARKQHARGATVYSYWFTWTTPVLDGEPGSPHCIDLPMAFNNIARCDQSTGNTESARQVGRAMSGAFVNFARTGNPGQPGLPWPAYDPERTATMVFDADSAVMDDPLGSVRRWMDQDR